MSMAVMPATIYTYDPGRLTTGKTLSENYVFIKNKGSIAFVASSHYGVVNYLNILLNDLYRLLAMKIMEKASEQFRLMPAENDLPAADGFSGQVPDGKMGIHGDPAITISEEKLPDYDIEAQNVKISPSFISVSDNHFNVAATFYNLGKAVSDSITVLFTRKYPDGSALQSF